MKVIKLFDKYDVRFLNRIEGNLRCFFEDMDKGWEISHTNLRIASEDLTEYMKKFDKKDYGR